MKSPLAALADSARSSAVQASGGGARAANCGDCRDFGYEPLADWPKLPPDVAWTEVAAVTTDTRDRVYVFARGPHRVLVFAADGTLLEKWGEGVFVRPHGICIGPDGNVYCTDDADHTVRKFTPHGELLLTLGASGRPSDTGATSVDYRTIRHAGPPFHFPTNAAFAPSGELYVADGYGNARVHRFAADGRLLASWGSPGSGPGQFQVPHGIAVSADGRVLVADRENSRIQIFTADGQFLEQWTDVARPCQVCLDSMGTVYVAELGYRAGRWPGTGEASPGDPPGRLSIFSSRGELLARWGGDDPCAAGSFFAPHDVCVDSRGDVYVAEVVMSAGGNRGLVPASCRSLQKFVRQSSAP